MVRPVFSIASTILLLFSAAVASGAGPCDAYFSFDGDLSDSGGNGFDGQMVGPKGTLAAPTFVAGKFGQALQLDGSAAMRSFIDLSYDICPEATFAAWINVEPLPNQMVLGVSHALHSMVSGSGISLRVRGDDLWAQDAVLPNAGWMFIAGTWNSTTGRVSLHWRNRTIEGKMGSSDRDTPTAIWLGALNDDLHFPAKQMVIDEFRIISRALDPDQLMALQMSAGSGGATAKGACSAHGECAAGYYCAVEGTCHPDAHRPMESPPADPRVRDIGPQRAPFQPDIGANPPGVSYLDYAIAQVNSTVAQSHFVTGAEIPLHVRVQVHNAADSDSIVFYAALGKPQSSDAVIMSERYEGQGDGPHIITINVPLDPPLVTGQQFEADLFLLSDKQMPGLPGQTVTIQVPLEDSDPANNRKSLVYNVQSRPELDYAIAQVNSTVAESHFKYGNDIPLNVRISAENASEQQAVAFYVALGVPQSNDAVVLSDRYEGVGPGPHIVSFDVPLRTPLVDGDQFQADVFLLSEARVPVEDGNPDNDRESVQWDVKRYTGYVLTHEHPTYGMAFGGNYAFAGKAGNYQNGIMEVGYTESCAGCSTLEQCDHGEVKGNFVGWLDLMGRDMDDHLPHMGPRSDSFSHLRYSTDWIEQAYKPDEPKYEDARLRIMVALAVENEAMCEQLYYVNKGNGGPGGNGYPCSRGDSFDSLKRQLDSLKAWAAAHGSWMEIAYSASDARRIVNDDKLAIVLGIEAEYAFGAEDRTFDPVERLDDYYGEGVRTFYLAHKINSRLAGADVYAPAGSDPGKAIRATQAVFGCFYYDDNVAHFPLQESLVLGTGFKVNVCDNNCGANAFKGAKPTDSCAYKYSDISESNMSLYVLSRGNNEFNGFAIYPWTPGFEGEGGTRIVNDIERNNLGLSHDGERVVRAAMQKGMIVNIDHVSSNARRKMHELATDVFDNYPLNALHNKPNDRYSNKGKYKAHEYDMAGSELQMIKETGGFFGFRMGPTDSREYPNSGISEDCPATSTESAKMLAWLIDEGLNVGYALDYATTTKAVFSRTMVSCGLDLGPDDFNTYGKHYTEGLSHVGMMKKWHLELEHIGLAESYVETLKHDGVEAFLEMWEKSEAASTTGAQIPRTVFRGANPQVH